MNRVPIEFKPYTYKSPLTDEEVHAGYLCRLYLLVVYDESEYSSFKIYSFTSESDMMDNAAILQELGIQYRIDGIRFPITPFTLPDMYKRIQDYVSSSNND